MVGLPVAPSKDYDMIAQWFTFDQISFPYRLRIVCFATLIYVALC